MGEQALVSLTDPAEPGRFNQSHIFSADLQNISLMNKINPMQYHQEVNTFPHQFLLNSQDIIEIIEMMSHEKTY